MNRLPTILCQIYLVFVLLSASILSPLPYSPLAVALLLAILFLTFRRLHPRLNIAITAATLFLLSLILKSILQYLVYTMSLSAQAIQIIAVIATLPVVYLLDCNLRQNAQIMAPAPVIKGRYIFPIPQTLLTSATTILLVSYVLNNTTLLYAAITLIVYLAVVLIRILLAIPSSPIDTPTTWKRVIAGTAVDIPLDVANKTSLRLHCIVSPVDLWVKVKPPRFTMDKSQTRLNITATPPLGGPSRPPIEVSAIDQWGFTQINQTIEPVELHVIPRVRYAEWLAMKYLEETGARGTATTTPTRASTIPRRGTEYLDSRSYQPGDSLRHVDWKHTLKLNQLIIKEYVEAGRQTAIISVNLSVSNAEEADMLAFNLITTALTLAGESIPTALAAYDYQKVVLTTTITDPRKILKRTLSLIKDITVVEFAHRFLQPLDVGKLKRNITRLEKATSEPAQRLLNMFNFEYQAIEQAAKNHQTTIALSRTTKYVPSPAIIILISQWNHDAEALGLTTEKLSRVGFTIIPIKSSKQPTALFSNYP